MSTSKQELLVKNITENHSKPPKERKTDGELVEMSGYGPSMKAQPSRAIKTKGVQQILYECGITKELVAYTLFEEILRNDVDRRTRSQRSSPYVGSSFR